MREYFGILLLFILCRNVYSQQISLEGLVTVQNSRVTTGQTEYVSDVSVSHPNAKPTSTDIHGKFRLNILGIRSGTQIGIEIIPKGKYRDYLVVNDWEIQDITLGRALPVEIYICKKDDIEQRKAELVGINARKYKEKVERKIAQLEKRISALEDANDYANDQYQKALDTLAILNNDRSKSIQRIREFAEYLSLINLDEVDSIYLHAYRLFELGEIDSVAMYLKRNIDYEKESTITLNQIKVAKKKLELAHTMESNALLELENANLAKNNLIKSLNLSAEANRLRFEYKLACHDYEKILKLDSLDIQARKSLADILLYDIGSASNAKKHYLFILNKYVNKKVVADSEVYLDVVINLGICFTKIGSAGATDVKLFEIARESLVDTIQEMDDKVGFSLDSYFSFFIYQNLIKVNYYLVKCYIYQGRLDDALNIAHQNVDLLNRFEDECAFWFPYSQIADIYIAKKDFEKSEEYLNKALISCQETFNSQVSCDAIWERFMRLYEAKKDYPTAISFGTKLLSSNQKEYQENKRKNLLLYTESLIVIADLERKNGNLEMTKKYLLEADSVFVNHFDYINSLGNNGEEYIKQISEIKGELAEYYEEVGEQEQAIQCLKDALNLLSPFLYHSININKRYLSLMLKSSDFYVRQKQFDQAESILFFAQKILDKETDSVYFEYKAEVLKKIGDLFGQKGDTQKFIKYTKEAIDVYEQIENKEPHYFYRTRASLLGDIAQKLDAQKDHQNAMNYYQRSIALWELSDEELGLAVELNNLSTNQGLRKCYHEAILTVQKSINILKKHARKSQYYVSALGNLSAYQLFIKEFISAEKNALKALSIDNSRVLIKINLANALLLQGKYEDAWTIYRELTSIDAANVPGDKKYSLICIQDLKELMAEGAVSEEHTYEVRKIINKLTTKQNNNNVLQSTN